MHDSGFLLTIAIAFAIFAAFALFAQRGLDRLLGARRIKRPPPALIAIFRAWFGLLALGALYLFLFGREGLFPR